MKIGAIQKINILMKRQIAFYFFDEKLLFCVVNE